MYTREMHLKMAKCLKLAKRHLNDGEKIYNKEPFVCLAISCTSVSTETKKAVHKWINNQLGGYAFVTTWAHVHGVKLGFKDYQAYRHAWVDHMIKVLES